ncbi:MAG: hypothetical protein WBD71_00170 [Xanthobacteraceae bacterium]
MVPSLPIAASLRKPRQRRQPHSQRIQAIALKSEQRCIRRCNKEVGALSQAALVGLPQPVEAANIGLAVLFCERLLQEAVFAGKMKRS